MSDFMARVIAELDTINAEKQMQSFIGKKRSVDLDINLVSKGANINSIINQMKSQFDKAGSAAGNNFASAFNSMLGNINTKNSEYTMQKLQRTLAGFKFDSSQISTITKSLDSMDLAVQKVETRIRQGGNLGLKVTGIDEIGRTVTVLKEFDAKSNTLVNVGKNIVQSFGSVKGATAEIKKTFTDLDVSKLDSSITSLDSKFVKLFGSVNNESTALSRLKSDLSEISNIDGIDNQQREFDRIKTSVEELSISYKTAKAENDKLVASQQLMAKKTILGNQINTWMNKNTKAAKIYRIELEGLTKQLGRVSNGSQLKGVADAFNQIKTTAASSGNLGKSVFGILIQNMKNLSPLFGMGKIITSAIHTSKFMVSSVYELDTALVDLQKTTTMNSQELEKFYYDSNNVAKAMGVSTAQIINQASAWSRLGYSSADAASSMAKLSSQFKSISPGLSIDDATSGLVSIMKAFDVDVDDVLDGIMSKVNIIGNTAATSNADIVAMLQRSSSAMSEANNTLDETIALETAAFEIVQNAENVGTAYKTKLERNCLYVQKCA